MLNSMNTGRRPPADYPALVRDEYPPLRFDLGGTDPGTSPTSQTPVTGVDPSQAA